jgi:hypothetical protein
MRYLFYLVFVFCFSSVFAQNAPDNLYREYKAWIDIKDTEGIRGTKFMYGDWNQGMLVLSDSLFFRQNYLAYDAQEGKILIKKEENSASVFEVNDANLTGFSIIENQNGAKHDFVSLYAKHFKDQNSHGYYEIVNNVYKTNYLIKNTKKVIYDPNKSKGTAAINNFPMEYKDETTYYLKGEDGLYVEVGLKKKAIMRVLNKHEDKMQSYIKSKKINFSSELQVADLANYYYSLD